MTPMRNRSWIVALVGSFALMLTPGCAEKPGKKADDKEEKGKDKKGKDNKGKDNKDEDKKDKDKKDKDSKKE